MEDVLGFHRCFSFNPCRIGDLGPENRPRPAGSHELAGPQHTSLVQTQHQSLERGQLALGDCRWAEEKDLYRPFHKGLPFILG
jgi:hypothetical protein